MRPGRIWVELHYLDEETRSIVQKDTKFRQWFDQLAYWIRKNYEHVDRMVYAGRKHSGQAGENCRLIAESTLDVLPVSRSFHREWRIRFGYYPGGHCTPTVRVASGTR